MKKHVFIILFNLFELILVVLFGLLLKTDWIIITILLLTWMITRSLVPKPMHYKSPIRCFLMTILMFISLYLATRVHLIIGVLFVIFDAIVLSQHGNVKDALVNVNNNMFQWNGNSDKRGSKYQNLIDYVANNVDCPVMELHEEYWKEYYPNRYNVFVKFFRERKTYEAIVSELNLKDTTIIKTECKIIYSTLEIPLDLNNQVCPLKVLN